MSLSNLIRGYVMRRIIPIGLVLVIVMATVSAFAQDETKTTTGSDGFFQSTADWIEGWGK